MDNLAQILTSVIVTVAALGIAALWGIISKKSVNFKLLSRIPFVFCAAIVVFNIAFWCNCVSNIWLNVASSVIRTIGLAGYGVIAIFLLVRPGGVTWKTH